MTPKPLTTARLAPTAASASLARGHESVVGVSYYWPGYWFSDGVPAAGS
ncbi:hypothetical protein [Halomonas organivorans]|uniref:Uncharacterized protein n=1 Tax=Halomonas organivorans TaxID=257772 RepID=A0A7W5BZX8_9GAMM|nr:hypothetical protein [Halomonas organivorans]MBB3142270.1 hypothetical protein [Halomonas organivorans]